MLDNAELLEAIKLAQEKRNEALDCISEIFNNVQHLDQNNKYVEEMLQLISDASCSLIELRTPLVLYKIMPKHKEDEPTHE